MASPGTTRALIGAIAIALIAWSLWRIFDPPPEALPAEDQAWYFDLEKRREFSAPALQIPPIRSPWGNPAARVFFFSCGDCADRFPGFFLQFNPETKAKLDADSELWQEALGESYEGRMYSADGISWVEAPSVDQSGVTAGLAARCPGKLRVCR